MILSDIAKASTLTLTLICTAITSPVSTVAQSNNVSGNVAVTNGNIYQSVVQGWRDGLILNRGTTGYTIGMGVNGSDLQFGNVSGGLSDLAVQMTVAGNGNVGIGTTNPNAKLEVHQANQNNTTMPLLLSNPSGVNDNTAVGEGFNVGDVAKGGIFFVRNPSAAYGTGDFYFATNQIWDNSTTVSPKDAKMVLKNNGNVGIGTTTPTSRLSVAGPVQSLEGGFQFPDGTVQSSAAAPLNIVAGPGITISRAGNTITITLATSASNPPPTGTLNVNVEAMTSSGSVTARGTNGATYTCSTSFYGQPVPCSYSFPQGTAVTLTAVPSSLKGFYEQFGNCGTVTIGSAVQTCGVEFYSGN